MRLNAACLALMFVSWVVALRPVIARDSAGDGGLGPFSGTAVQFMKRAKAVYVFSVKANSPENPKAKDLRPLGPQAREALVGTLLDNLVWVTGGLSCERRDIGILFQSSKDKLILRFCSVYDPYTGCEFEGTFRQESLGGWLKKRPWEAWKQRFAHVETR